MRVDADDRRVWREITAETSGVIHLRHKASVGKRRSIAETITSVRRPALDLNLERFESDTDPLTDPARDRLIARAELAA